MQYYVEMDKVDSMPELNKFYFDNEVVCSGLRGLSGYTFTATYNGSEYQFIDGKVSNWSGPAEVTVSGGRRGKFFSKKVRVRQPCVVDEK